MKKLMAALLVMATVMAAVTAIFTTSVSATAKKADVGRSNGTFIKGFEGKENQIKEAFVKEWERGQCVFAENGKEYFDYGDTTDEYAHAWFGKSNMIAQDFLNGSISTGFEIDQILWCAIVCSDPKDIMGSTFTVRDAIANVWAVAGGPNSDKGAPTSNQFWMIKGGEEYLYQKFQNGFYEALNGKYYNAEFFYKDDGEKIPSGVQYDDRPSFMKNGTTSRSSSNASYGTGDTGSVHSAINKGNVAGISETPATASKPTGSTDIRISVAVKPSESSSQRSLDVGEALAESEVTSDVTEGAVIGDEDIDGFGPEADFASAIVADVSIGKSSNMPVIIIMLAGLSVVLGGGVFAVYWFVIRRRKLLTVEDEECYSLDTEEDPDKTINKQ